MILFLVPSYLVCVGVPPIITLWDPVGLHHKNLVGMVLVSGTY